MKRRLPASLRRRRERSGPAAEALRVDAATALQHLGFLVAEELVLSDDFRHRLAARSFARFRYHACTGLAYAASDRAVEVELRFRSREQSDCALLITIGGSVKDVERLIGRGQAGCGDGRWACFKVCAIVASPLRLPVSRASDRELVGRNCGEGPAMQIGGPELRGLFAAGNCRDPRQVLRGRVAELAVPAAVDRAALPDSTSPPAADDAAEFFARYYELVEKTHPGLGVHRPARRVAANTCVRFVPAGYDESVELVHAVREGQVKLVFFGMAADHARIRAAVEHLGDPAVEVARVGFTVVVAIAVPPIDLRWRKRFTDWTPEIAAALRALAKLDSMYWHAEW